MEQEQEQKKPGLLRKAFVAGVLLTSIWAADCAIKNPEKAYNTMVEADKKAYELTPDFVKDYLMPVRKKMWEFIGVEAKEPAYRR